MRAWVASLMSVHILRKICIYSIAYFYLKFVAFTGKITQLPKITIPRFRSLTRSAFALRREVDGFDDRSKLRHS